MTSKTETTDAPPRCTTRTLKCERYEIQVEPPTERPYWACRNPDCALAIRACGEPATHE